MIGTLLILSTISVTDGDTLRSGDLRVRLWGIDAPEMDEHGGSAATEALRGIISGQDLTCQVTGTDRYRRIVARCELPDGRDIACEMVAAGMARDWPRYSNGAYRDCHLK
jgi:endonuclease YncB( thermonuclease family)